MKNKRVSILFFLVAATFVIFPDIVSEGAENGLKLWLQVVFPALFPFMIFSSVLVKKSMTGTIGKCMYPFFYRLFGISSEGCYAITTGLLAGYPVGAKTVGELCACKRISRQEGQFLLYICNNASPMFILQFLGSYCMGMRHPWKLLLIVHLSSWLNAFLIQKRFGYYHSGKTVIKWKSEEKKKITVVQAVDESIQEAFVTLTKIGGYIILFSVLALFFGKMLPVPALFKACGIGILEITTGGNYLRCCSGTKLVKWLSGCAICAFGGLSSVAQTAGVLRGSGLSTRKYVYAKLSQILWAIILAGIIYLWESSSR